MFEFFWSGWKFVHFPSSIVPWWLIMLSQDGSQNLYKLSCNTKDLVYYLKPIPVQLVSIQLFWCLPQIPLTVTSLATVSIQSSCSGTGNHGTLYVRILLYLKKLVLRVVHGEPNHCDHQDWAGEEESSFVQRSTGQPGTIGYCSTTLIFFTEQRLEARILCHWCAPQKHIFPIQSEMFRISTFFVLHNVRIFPVHLFPFFSTIQKTMAV